MQSVVCHSILFDRVPGSDVASGLLVLLLLFIIIFPNFILYIVFFLEIESKVHSTLSCICAKEVNKLLLLLLLLLLLIVFILFFLNS